MNDSIREYVRELEDRLKDALDDTDLAIKESERLREALEKITDILIALAESEEREKPL